MQSFKEGMFLWIVNFTFKKFLIDGKILVTIIKPFNLIKSIINSIRVLVALKITIR